MRKSIYAMAPARGVELLARAPSFQLATTTPDGAPVLKTLHGVVHGEHLYWHGSRGGEKARSTGRAAVASADELVAEIPSHWVDPERACPATTYYESVQIHGTTEPVSDPREAAAALQALMERYQPEGQHVRITHDHPLYADELRRLLVVRLSLAKTTVKGKLGQNRTPAQMAGIAHRLWQRGGARDLAAIDRILCHHPRDAEPAWLASDSGARLVPDVRSADDVPAAAALLADTYWNRGRFDQTDLEAALRASPAVVGARDRDTGHLVAIARAISDDRKRAWIYDVCVHPAWRRRGLGRDVVTLLLDHARVRDCGEVHLGTRDGQGFYESLGFGAQSVHMVLKRR
jgi:nitroimidazol reductase NimA-like FMN-containing flavoprotein (pyridoxamine 5'-phosphate oxidase superfamily)/ribosomal protein S18 acetylase RimI-like enzyme